MPKGWMAVSDKLHNSRQRNRQKHTHEAPQPPLEKDSCRRGDWPDIHPRGDEAGSAKAR